MLQWRWQRAGTARARFCNGAPGELESTTTHVVNRRGMLQRSQRSCNCRCGVLQPASRRGYHEHAARKHESHDAGTNNFFLLETAFLPQLQRGLGECYNHGGQMLEPWRTDAGTMAASATSTARCIFCINFCYHQIVFCWNEHQLFLLPWAC